MIGVAVLPLAFGAAPSLVGQSAEQQFWARLPEQERPGPQEQDGARLVFRALLEADPQVQLTLLSQARARLLQPTRFRGRALCAEASLLGRLDQVEKAEPLILECLTLLPGDPQALRLSSFLKMRRTDPSEGVQEFMAAVGRDPSIVSGVGADDFDIIFRKLTYVGRSDLAAEFLQVLANTAWGRDDPARSSNLALQLIPGLLAKGRKSEAVQLLPRVLDPEVGLRLVVDRAYDPIRDEIENWSGGTLEMQRDAFVRATETAFSIAPDMAHRLNYASALLSSGRPKEAVALLDAAVRDASQWGDSEQDYYYLGVAAVRLAGAMRQAGQNAASTAMLGDIEPKLRQHSPGFALNIIPNLVRYLLRDHKPDEALALLDARTPAADQVEAAGALGHFEALRLCARKQKGETVASDVAAFKARYRTNPLVLGTLAGCLGDEALAKERVLVLLGEGDKRGDLLVAYQAMQLGHENPNMESANELLRLTAKDAEVRRALLRLSRPAPSGYRAALLGWHAAS
ncbi:hypothetical protein [Sphingomonas sp.]|uniref:hypothetical protein n=1 Tax=Sphingomonas sp. TaxID=28214 RepID=UPI002DB8EC68|nr:hypothetical protein [Sphingomonas sp.]HEU4967898.1 hypothetical protein [Sphingomonas sp.]